MEQQISWRRDEYIVHRTEIQCEIVGWRETRNVVISHSVDETLEIVQEEGTHADKE